MSLLTLEYNRRRLANMLAGADSTVDPVHLATGFVNDLESLLLRLLNEQQIYPLGRIGTNGPTEFNSDARGRGDIEVLLEVVTPEFVDSTILHGLAVFMHVSSFSLTSGPKYEAGTYKGLEIVTMAIVHRGYLVSKT